MTIKNLEFFKRNLSGCIVEGECKYGTHINKIYVLAQRGLYKIIQDYVSDMYLVEYISNLGHKEYSSHSTMSGTIYYIKGGNK